jgi:hypothetical protein
MYVGVHKLKYDIEEILIEHLSQNGILEFQYMEFRRSIAHKCLDYDTSDVKRTKVPGASGLKLTGEKIVSVHREASNDNVCKVIVSRDVRGQYVGQGSVAPCIRRRKGKGEQASS